MSATVPSPAPFDLPSCDALVARALEEDLATAGDVTGAAVVPREARARGLLVTREDGIVAGLPLALAVFATVSSELVSRSHVEDGWSVAAGTTLAEISGPASPLLVGERTALNFLGHLSGIATATARLVSLVAGTGVRIADTRKTTPGLRALEKYAVRVGGGSNHRFGLHDAVLIKDNHLVVAGGIRPAVVAARRRVGHLVSVEVEVETLAQLEEALEVGVDAVLLDNMDLDTMRRAVDLVAGRLTVEASGGITAETVRAVADTGVDVISVGWLTHSAPALDVACDVFGG